VCYKNTINNNNNMSFLSYKLVMNEIIKLLRIISEIALIYNISMRLINPTKFNESVSEFGDY